MKDKILPVRMCCVCRKHKQKDNLNKFVIKDDNIIFDKFYKEFGRGAYICKDINCFEKAKKQKSLNKALKFNITDKKYDELKEIVFYDD